MKHSAIIRDFPFVRKTTICQSNKWWDASLEDLEECRAITSKKLGAIWLVTKDGAGVTGSYYCAECGKHELEAISNYIIRDERKQT